MDCLSASRNAGQHNLNNDGIATTSGWIVSRIIGTFGNLNAVRLVALGGLLLPRISG